MAEQQVVPNLLYNKHLLSAGPGGERFGGGARGRLSLPNNAGLGAEGGAWSPQRAQGLQGWVCFWLGPQLGSPPGTHTHGLSLWLELPHSTGAGWQESHLGRHVTCYALALEVRLVVFAGFCPLKDPPRHTQVLGREVINSLLMAERQGPRGPHVPSAIPGPSEEVGRAVLG